jgi:hypothetical protein
MRVIDLKDLKKRSLKKTARSISFTMDDLKGIIHKYLYLEDDTIVDVMMGAYVANRLPGDPSWILFVAPPSMAKTELLRGFSGHRHAYFLSSLTPSTLISGMKPTKNNPEPSLLPKLSDKVLILKDFTTVLSMRSEQQSEILSQLREVYDGSFVKAFGTGHSISWSGHMGLMGAVTPVYDRHHSVIGAMGDRFLLYRNTVTKANRHRMNVKAMENAGSEKHIRYELQESIHGFIDQFEKAGKNRLCRISSEIEDAMNHLACFCADARCSVERDPRSKLILYKPRSEGPSRLIKQLKQIGNGIARVHGKTTIDEEVYRIIRKIGIDLVETSRLEIIGALYHCDTLECLDAWEKTPVIAQRVRIPVSTAHYILQELEAVEIVNCRKGKTKKAGHSWQLCDHIVTSIAKAGLNI